MFGNVQKELYIHLTISKSLGSTCEADTTTTNADVKGIELVHAKWSSLNKLSNDLEQVGVHVQYMDMFLYILK